MNNSFVQSKNLENEEKIDTRPMLRARQERNSNILQAISDISSSPAWKILKEEIFDDLVGTLYRQLSKEKDEKRMFHLQGELAIAEKFADFSKFGDIFRKQIEGINKQLQTYAES